MSWESVRIGLIQARNYQARENYLAEGGDGYAWDETSLLAEWDYQLNYIKSKLVNVLEDGATVVALWDAETTCPDSVRRLVTERVCMVIREETPCDDETRKTWAGKRTRLEKELKMYADGTLALLDNDGDPYELADLEGLVESSTDSLDQQMYDNNAPGV